MLLYEMFMCSNCFRMQVALYATRTYPVAFARKMATLFPRMHEQHGALKNPQAAFLLFKQVSFYLFCVICWCLFSTMMCICIYYMVYIVIHRILLHKCVEFLMTERWLGKPRQRPCLLHLSPQQCGLMRAWMMCKCIYKHPSIYFLSRKCELF